MKKKTLSILAIVVVLVLFYQQILLAACKIGLHCFLPKTFSYQKIAWNKNVLQIQGLVKGKNELTVDSIDLFYQEGNFHIRFLHPQYLDIAGSKSRNIFGTLLGLSRFFSVEVQHGVLELKQWRYYFSLLPIAQKTLELKLAMDPDPLYPALLTLHYCASNELNLSIKSQELKHLLPLACLVGYLDKGLSYQAEMSLEANAIVHSNGDVEDIHVKTLFTNVKVQQGKKQFFCDQIEAELSAEKVDVKDLWHSFKGNLQLQNGSYALLSQNLEWQNRLMHIEVDLSITDQPKGFLSAVAVDKNGTFPLILETTSIYRDQQEIKMEAIFSDLVDKNIQGSLTICQGRDSVIECDVQKFDNRHLSWAISCFALPQIALPISYEWKNCSVKVAMLFSDQALRSVDLRQFQAKDLWIDHSSHKFLIKDAWMQGKWDADKSQITEGFCQLEQVEGLNIVMEYPNSKDAISAHIQGDLSAMFDLSFALPFTTDLTVDKNKLELVGSILNMPFLAEAVLLKPFFSLENGLCLQPAQGYIKLKDLTEEQYEPWLAKFLPQLIAKGSYQLECLFDTNKVLIGIEGEEIHFEHFCKTMDIPKISDLSFQYQEGKWSVSCPRLEGKLSYKEKPYSFSTTLDTAYPQLNIQNFSLTSPDFSIKANVSARYQDLWNLQLQIIEMQRQEKDLIKTPFLAEIAICPESRMDLSTFHYKIIADFKNLSLPITSIFKLEEGSARLELDSHANKLCLTQGSARIYQDKKKFCSLEIDSLTGAIDSFSDANFSGSLQIKEIPALQVKGALHHPGVDAWQIECNLTTDTAETWQIQLSTEDLFEQYDFSCLNKDVSIFGKKLPLEWHIHQMQIGSLIAAGIFTSEETKLHCKSIEGSYKGYPFLASGVFDMQTHAIYGQVDCNSISLKSSPFICEYSVEQGFFSKQIDLTVQDLKSSERLANLFCHHISYRKKTLESTMDFSLTAFPIRQIPVTWQQNLSGRIEVKRTPELMLLSGDLKQGDFILEQQLIHHKNTKFFLENTHFLLSSELNLGEKPFWGTLRLEYDKIGEFEISDQPLQAGLKGCFRIDSNKCKIDSVKGKSCGITADLEAKETNNLYGTLQINISDFASFIPLLKKAIQPLELEANFLYQGEISKQGCNGLLQADQIEIKGFSVNKFSAGVELCQNELQIHDFRLDDQAGSLFAKTMSCKNLNSWELWIPEVEIKQLQLDHVWKKAKPFVIDVLIKDMQAQLSDLQTLHALGQCKFQYLNQDQFFEIPLDILSTIGLDLRSFMPIEGELEFKLQEGRCYLTQLAKTFSKNGHCKFALAKKKKQVSYIGFDGSLSIDLQLKQKKLLKLINPFTFTVRGTLDHPKYGLVLLN